MRKLLLAAAVLMVASACGSDEPAVQVRDTPPAAGGCAATATANKGAKPTITIPNCAPPKTLQKVDVIAGTGAELKPGQTAKIHYAGLSWSTKKQFDASWERGEPYETQIPGELIEGWNEGVPGMKVGGRRLLTIPPEKGYGASGRGADIKPNETLVFAIDLVSVS